MYTGVSFVTLKQNPDSTKWNIVLKTITPKTSRETDMEEGSSDKKAAEVSAKQLAKSKRCTFVSESEAVVAISTEDNKRFVLFETSPNAVTSVVLGFFKDLQHAITAGEVYAIKLGTTFVKPAMLLALNSGTPNTFKQEPPPQYDETMWNR